MTASVFQSTQNGITNRDIHTCLDIGMASVGAALLADDHIMALHVRA